MGIAAATLLRGGWRIRDIGELSFRQFCWVAENIQRCGVADSKSQVQMERLAIASCFSKEGDEAFKKTIRELDKVIG